MVLLELTSLDLSDLPMDAFKAHLRLGTGFDDADIQDQVLESYIRAAMAAIEARIGKMLITRQVVWEITRWTGSDCQALPVAPINAIDTVVLTDRMGTQSVIEETAYRLERDAQRPRMRAAGGALPVIPQGGTARITFNAGFGPGWLDVPPDLREAVFLLAAHYYENRRDQNGSGGLMPFGVMALLDAHRTIRLFGAA